MNNPIESKDTVEARKKLKKMFYKQNYEIEEEVPLDTVTNNMGEGETWPPYRADMLLTKMFILELDPQSNKKGKSKGHGTRKMRIHDQWRDRNIKNQIQLKTVRLIPEDILKQTDEQIFEEIDWQLRQNYQD